MSSKRTRPIKKYFITIPRVAISEPGVYQLKVKVSRVIIEKVKDLPSRMRTKEGKEVEEAILDLGGKDES